MRISSWKALCSRHSQHKYTKAKAAEKGSEVLQHNIWKKLQSLHDRLSYIRFSLSAALHNRAAQSLINIALLVRFADAKGLYSRLIPLFLEVVSQLTTTQFCQWRSSSCLPQTDLELPGWWQAVKIEGKKLMSKFIILQLQNKQFA